MVLNSLGDLLTKRCATRVFAKQKEIKMDPKDHSIPATAATNCYLGGRVHREGQTLAAGVPTSMLCLTGLTWLIPRFQLSAWAHLRRSKSASLNCRTYQENFSHMFLSSCSWDQYLELYDAILQEVMAFRI